MGRCPMPRQSFSRKRLDQKALMQKSIRFFGRFILLSVRTQNVFIQEGIQAKKSKAISRFRFFAQVL